MYIYSIISFSATREGDISERGEVCDSGGDHRRGGGLPGQGRPRGGEGAGRPHPLPAAGRPGQEGHARGVQGEQTHREHGGQAGRESGGAGQILVSVICEALGI